MRVTLLLLLGVALALVLAVQAAPHRDWKKIGGVAPSQLVPVSFSLKNRNQEWLNKFVDEVSNPLHPNWRQYLTQEKLRAMTAPSETEVRQLVGALSKLGMQKYELYASGDFIMSQWTVKDVEQAFSVRMDRFRHVRSNQVIHRSLTQYQLPASLQSLVAVVGMISEFPEGHFHSRGLGKSNNVPHAPQSLSSADVASNCSAVMNWGYPASSDTDLYSQVQIVCCNGQFTTDVDAPCSDQGGQLIGFNTYVLSGKNNATVSTATMMYPDVRSGCFLDGDSVTCSLTFTPHSQVEPYNLYNIQVSGIFMMNNVSVPVSTFPVPLATSPFVTPQSFAEKYQIPLHWSSRYPASENSQSVVEFGGEYYSPSDLKSFFGNMSLPDTPASVVGRNDASVPGSEATLDIQWIMAVGVQVDTVFLSVSTGYLIEWTAQLLSSSDIPLVNSVSYGGNEVDLPLVYRSTVDTQFQKLSALGVSIVVSSGDAGATNVGHGSESCVALLPQYPAASPYVTSVSATYFTPSAIPMCTINYYGKTVHCADSSVGEIAVSAGDGMDWTTGGGFSGDVPRPSWQQQQVNNYLVQHADLLPPSSMFNASNRAYPDVSATGHNLMLIRDDAMDIGDGTSASAPIFAGILSLINQYLLSIGEGPVGFANPLLYTAAQQSPASFYDVTVGSNACGDVLHPPYIACCEHGYKSATGWDPVTGLGTPRFAPLFGVVKDLVKQQQMTA